MTPPGQGLQIATTGAICATQQAVPFTIDVYQEIEGEPGRLLRRGPLRSTMELDEAVARAWDGYNLEVFALLMPDGLPGAEGRLLWTMNWRDEGLTPSRALPVRQWARFGNAPVRAELLWLPADKPRQAIGGDVENASDSDLRHARAGVRLLRLTSLLDTVGGVLDRGGGRPPTPKESKIDKLARDGLKWLKAHQYSSVEDVGRPQLSEARNRSLKATNDHMGRQPTVINADVHRRMYELLDEENPTS